MHVFTVGHTVTVSLTV